MTNEQSAHAERPDPEEQAGQALRRLRLARGWSQEEVATRMKAYGYDFHQTTIAKIEAAQRPLRVRELAHFATLYQVEAHELIYPLNGSLEQIDREIAELMPRLEKTRNKAERAAMARAEAHYILEATINDHMVLSSELANLDQRLNYLRTEREKFTPWENDEEPASSHT